MKVIATFIAATAAAFLFGTGTAKACEYDCYDSGNTVPRSTALTPNVLLLRMLFRLETLDVSDIRPQR